MYFCEFCGKGPFSASSSLNKHLWHSSNCNEAARQKWDIHAENIWKNAPSSCPPNNEQQHPVLPPLPEEDDLTLNNDLQDFDDNPPDIEIPPEQPGHHVTIDRLDKGDEEHELSKAGPSQKGVVSWGPPVSIRLL